MTSPDQAQRKLQHVEFSEQERYYTGNARQIGKSLAARMRFIGPALDTCPERPDVLEISAGAGYLAMEIERRRPDARLVLTEFTANRFRHEAYAGLGAFKIACDALDLPFGADRFNLVYLNGVLHHVPDLFRALDQIVRVLKPGGQAVLIEPNRANPFYWTIAALKKPERGILFADYPATLDLLEKRRKDFAWTIEHFDSYATFHGGWFNTLAGILGAMTVLPRTVPRFNSHNVLLIRKTPTPEAAA